MINMPEQKSGCTALHLAVRDNLLKLACNLITEVKNLWSTRGGTVQISHSSVVIVLVSIRGSPSSKMETDYYSLK